MHCPTLDEVTGAVLSLLPRGRAWQTYEGEPRPPSVLWQYWRSFAVVLHYLNDRLCDLREEFWCATMRETRDGWLKEYGLPDACDPFPDICTKVAALGGSTCDYYRTIASRAGWAIDCADGTCAAFAGCSRAGRARTGRIKQAASLTIRVYLDESPAYQPAGRYLPSVAGRMRSGRRLACGPDLTPLKCLLSRIVHAEIALDFEVITYGY